MANDNKLQESTAHEPEQTLRQLIGKDTKLSEVFTPERIKSCQDTIDNARNSFFETADHELMRLEKLLVDHSTDADIKPSIFDDFAELASDIKEQADMFGFTLVSAICLHMVDYCDPGPHTPLARFRLLDGLAKLLHIAVKQKISDDKGELAQELKASLKKY